MSFVSSHSSSPFLNSAELFVPSKCSRRLANRQNLRSCPHQPHTTKATLQTFEASDFEIQRIVGQQSFATITDWEYYTPTPLGQTRTTEPSEPAIRLYDARIISSYPSLYNARVMLKEFLPPAIQLGVTEAEAYNILYSADIDPDLDEIPVASLLGTFLTDDAFASSSFALSWRMRFPKSPEPPTPEAPFMVFRWEGLQTAMTVATKPQAEDPQINWFSVFVSDIRDEKANYLRVFFIRSLDALIYLHSRGGLVHRSIGLASLMVNSSEWRDAPNLLVKLRDFGFAKPVSALAQGAELDRARRAEAFTPADIACFYFAEDIYALGYAFLELVFSVFSGRPVTQDTFKNLFEDTFDLSRDQIRQYCTQDPDWTDAVNFLDQCNQDGWSFLLTMLGARRNFRAVSLERLRNSPFLVEAV